jgi:phospholipase/carboxylesterase
MREVRRARIADLAVTVVADRDAAPALAVILCHGYGAPGDDLVPLAGALLAEMPGASGGLRFYFPEAPEPAAVGFGRAWWQLDLEHLVALSRGDPPVPGARRREVPPALGAARRRVRGAMEEILRQCGLPASRLVVGGFSQGAMLMTDLALRLEEAPAGLAVLSGTLLCAEEWRGRAPARSGLPVFQSHGRSDPLLPYADAEALRDLLAGAGLSVDFHEFDGGHEIPGEIVAALGRFLVRRLAG